MTREELLQRIQEGGVRLTFVSPVDKKTRNTVVTLNEEMIAESNKGVSKTQERSAEATFYPYRDNESVVCVWDLGDQGWRAMNYNTIKKIGKQVVNGIKE